jgi:hypothetical protein
VGGGGAEGGGTWVCWSGWLLAAAACQLQDMLNQCRSEPLVCCTVWVMLVL